MGGTKIVPVETGGTPVVIVEHGGTPVVVVGGGGVEPSTTPAVCTVTGTVASVTNYNSDQYVLFDIGSEDKPVYSKEGISSYDFASMITDPFVDTPVYARAYYLSKTQIGTIAATSFHAEVTVVASNITDTTADLTFSIALNDDPSVLLGLYQGDTALAEAPFTEDLTDQLFTATGLTTATEYTVRKNGEVILTFTTI